MREAFEKFINTVRSRVTDEFNDKGEIPPTWFFQKDDDNIAILVTPLKDDIQKDIVSWSIREVIKVEKIQRYAYVCESWYVRARQMTLPYKGPRPSECPDRKEGLLFTAEDISGEAVGGFSDIHRSSDLAMIMEVKLIPNFSSEGRFTNMFQPWSRLNMFQPESRQ